MAGWLAEEGETGQRVAGSSSTTPFSLLYFEGRGGGR